MKPKNDPSTKSATQGRKPIPAQESGHNINEPSDIFHLQLFMCQQLQKSLEVTELLNLYKNSLPSHSGVTDVSFIPVFKPLATEERAKTPNSHNIKLFTGKDFIGQLNIQFKEAPNQTLLTMAEETAKLIAFPLLHAMEYQQALKNSELDSLTKLKNRSAMNHALSKACNTTKRYDIPVSILMLDIDHFKKINDTYGHITGDKILQCLAEIIQQSCRLADEAFRFGGEEFLMVLPNTFAEGAFETAERVRKSIEINDFSGALDEKDLPITISIGIATHTSSNTDDTLEQFIDKADKALYVAKHNGRNQSCCFSMITKDD